MHDLVTLGRVIWVIDTIRSKSYVHTYPHRDTYYSLENYDSFHGNVILRIWGCKSFIAHLLYLAIIRHEFTSGNGNTAFR